MYTKALIFNLALQACLLTRQISNTDADKSNEAAVLNQQWDTAFRTALFDMDLDSTVSQQNLELIHDFTKDPPITNGQPSNPWNYVYKYPDKCAFFRRIVSCTAVDDKSTHIPKRVMIYQAKKAIFTQEFNAIGEYIPIDFPLQTLSAPAGQAIAQYLAWQSAPLITGKGAKGLRETIQRDYSIAKAMAKEIDSLESFSFQTEETMSEFVRERLR